MSEASNTASISGLLRELAGWRWLIREVGVRRSFRYWRMGRRQGWIKTVEEADAFANWFVANHVEPRDKSGL